MFIQFHRGVCCRLRFFALVQVFCFGTGAVGLVCARPVFVAVLVVSLALAVIFAGRFRGESGQSVNDIEPVRRPTRIITLVFKVLFFSLILWYLWLYARLWQLAYLRPPYDWDGLYYHLPAIQGWVAHGRICWLDNLPDLPFCNGYAMGVEAFTFFMHQVLGHSRLVNACNLWYWPLGFLALVEIAQRIGVRGYWRWITGALFMGSPLLISLSVTCYIDAGVFCTVLAAIASALIVACDERGRTWPALLLFGLSLGLMVGAKGTGVVGAVAIMMITLLARIKSDGVGTLPAWLKRMSLAGLVVVAVGGYWYIRNLIHTGNPIFPIRLEIGALTLCDGYDPVLMLAGNMPEYLQEKPALLRPLFAWLDAAYPTDGKGPVGNLGYIWVAGGLPAAMYLCLRQLLRRQREIAGKNLLTPLILLVCIVVLLFILSPARWWSRMTLCLHALGLPCLVLVLQQSVRNIGRRIWPVGITLLIAGVAGLGVWESNQVLVKESQAGREVTPTGVSYVSSRDFYFDGMSEVPGIEHFFAATKIARTTWAFNGVFLGGILSLPLDAREIIYIKRELDEAAIQELYERGVQWVAWDCYNQWAPPDKQHEEVPPILREIALEELVYETPWKCDLRFLRLQ